jgi:exosortase
MSKTAMISFVKHEHSRMDWLRYALVVAVLGLIGYAYFSQIINVSKNTAYSWLTAHWQNISHYSHGPLIPLIAGGILWWKRKALLKARVESDSRGLVIVVLAMGAYYIGVKGGQERLVVISFVLLLYGLALGLGGPEVLREVFFPISFLFLMVPLNFLEERVGVPLQNLMAICSAFFLNAVGIVTQRVGTGIYSSVFQFDVAAPCSGIRSLMALTTVTAAYAYVTQRSQWKRWMLFLSAIPLAVLGNMARVISIALVAQAYGQEVTLKAYHDYSGYIVYAVALGLMVGIGWLLNLPYGQVFGHWLKPVEARKTL